MAPSRIPPWRTHPMSGSQGPGPGADDAARRACARDHRQGGYGPLRASLHTPLCRLLTDLQGPSGRQTDGATKEDIFSSILRSNESTLGSRDSSRSRRQSRVSREIVSSSKGALVFLSLLSLLRFCRSWSLCRSYQGMARPACRSTCSNLSAHLEDRLRGIIQRWSGVSLKFTVRELRRQTGAKTTFGRLSRISRRASTSELE